MSETSQSLYGLTEGGAVGNQQRRAQLAAANDNGYGDIKAECGCANLDPFLLSFIANTHLNTVNVSGWNIGRRSQLA
jgi:hypothetical protein